MQNFEGGDAELVFPGAVRDGLQELARDRGVGLYTVLLAALQALLHRWTGQRDIPVGSPVTNRTHTDVEPLIGFFVNTLVHRTQVSGEQTFADLVAAVQEGASGAQRNQEVPFEAIVEDLRPERYLSQNPLFQVCFNFLPARPLRSPAGLTVERISGVRNSTSKFDLWISIVDRNDDLLVEVEYNSAVFDHDTVDRLLAAYRTVLEAVGRDAGTTIARLPVMTDQERARIEDEWGPRSETVPVPAELAHEQFAEHARRTPPRRWRYGTRAAASPTARSTSSPTPWPACCATGGWAAARWWRWPPSGHRSWSPACWAFSRRAAPTCRSIRPTPPSGSSICSTTARRSSSSPSGI
ncbi:hypothetical protein IHE61_30060 [Streptomyces sp. GKU 257-1]|nr:hypothetical protein [Streptomyces sp. GKU 257-1]